MASTNSVVFHGFSINDIPKVNANCIGDVISGLVVKCLITCHLKIQFKYIKNIYVEHTY